MIRPVLALALGGFLAQEPPRSQGPEDWDQLDAALHAAYAELIRSSGDMDGDMDELARAFWGRERALAERGEGRAVCWMLAFVSARPDELPWLEERVRAAGDAAWVADALHPLAAGLVAQQGREAALAAQGRLFSDEPLGRPAPELEGLAADGSALRLADRKGRVTVVVFFAVRFEPCVAELPAWRALRERHAEGELALLGVSADTDRAAFERRARELGVSWPCVFAGERGPNQWRWDVGRYPAIFVLDAQHVVRAAEVRGEELERAVSALRAAPRAKPGGG